jgi:thioredoxin family protein
MTDDSVAERYRVAYTFDAYAAAAQKNADFWRAVHRTAPVPDDLVRRGHALTGTWRLLVLSEDWCGDAVNTVPIIARFAEQIPHLDLRVLPRDQNLDLMDAHLSSGTRSIPAVLALDAEFVERGWWGPRPVKLQRWLRSDGLLLPKEERYARTRAWYARDRGRSVLTEVLEMLERGERRKNDPDPALGAWETHD